MVSSVPPSTSKCIYELITESLITLPQTATSTFHKTTSQQNTAPEPSSAVPSQKSQAHSSHSAHSAPWKMKAPHASLKVARSRFTFFPSCPFRRSRSCAPRWPFFYSTLRRARIYFRFATKYLARAVFVAEAAGCSAPGSPLAIRPFPFFFVALPPESSSCVSLRFDAVRWKFFVGGYGCAWVLTLWDRRITGVGTPRRLPGRVFLPLEIYRAV